MSTAHANDPFFRTWNGEFPPRCSCRIGVGYLTPFYYSDEKEIVYFWWRRGWPIGKSTGLSSRYRVCRLCPIHYERCCRGLRFSKVISRVRILSSSLYVILPYHNRCGEVSVKSVILGGFLHDFLLKCPRPFVSLHDFHQRLITKGISFLYFRELLVQSALFVVEKTEYSNATASSLLSDSFNSEGVRQRLDLALMSWSVELVLKCFKQLLSLCTHPSLGCWYSNITMQDPWEHLKIVSRDHPERSLSEGNTLCMHFVPLLDLESLLESRCLFLFR